MVACSVGASDDEEEDDDDEDSSDSANDDADGAAIANEALRWRSMEVASEETSARSVKIMWRRLAMFEASSLCESDSSVVRMGEWEIEEVPMAKTRVCAHRMSAHAAPWKSRSGQRSVT